MTEIKSVLLISNLLKPGASKLHDEISSSLKARNIEIVEHCFYGEPPAFKPPMTDLVMVLGGDGTVLYSARLCASMKLPIMAVNLGTFGFLAEIHPRQWLLAFESFQNGQMAVSPRIMLETVIKRNGRIISNSCCLNDCVISSTGMAKIVNLKVNISDQEVIEYQADGIILSTTTGSTAYSMAAGGPIVHPEVEAIIVNPINPFTLSNRPLLIPANQEVIIFVSHQQRTNLVLTLDGQEFIPLEPGDEVINRRHRFTADILCFRKMNFYEVVRKKLNWKGRPHD